MSGPNTITVAPAFVTACTLNEHNVYKVSPTPVTVPPGATLEIVMQCQTGFTVFLPYPHFFGAQIFEAALDASRSSGKQKVWVARMTRNNAPNGTPVQTMAYCVYSKDRDNFVVAGSPPKMNLQP